MDIYDALIPDLQNIVNEYRYKKFKPLKKLTLKQFHPVHKLKLKCLDELKVIFRRFKFCRGPIRIYKHRKNVFTYFMPTITMSDKIQSRVFRYGISVVYHWNRKYFYIFSDKEVKTMLSLKPKLIQYMKSNDCEYLPSTKNNLLLIKILAYDNYCINII